MLTDEQLYSRYLLGENEAVDELLLRHKEGLTWFIYEFVHSYDDAEDLMMDTFALLLFKRVRFRGDSSFKTWLYGIGRNLSLNYLRKHKNESVEIIDEAIPIEIDVESEVISKENSKALFDALNQLKPEYAQVLYLSYFARMDSSQIANVMKKTVKQIYNLTERAKKQLREIVDESLSI